MTDDIDDALACSGLRLALTPALEKQFELKTAPTRIAATRHFLLVSLLVDICALGLDEAHGALTLGLRLRLGIVAPILVAAVVMLSAERRIWQQGVLTVVPIFLGLTSIAAIGLTMGGRFAELYLSASGMVAFLVNAILPLRFRHACLLTLATISATTAMVFAVPGSTDPASLCGTLAFNAVVMVLTLSLNHRHERSSRIAFLHECRSRLQRQTLVALNRELETSSRTDPLTGLFNRRALQEAVERSRAEARRAARSFGLLMVDIDHFKALNDALGHAEGDRCLRIVAEAIRSRMRNDIDTVARFGGEEFAVVIAGGDEQAVGLAARRVKDAVEQLAIPHPGIAGTGHVTVSVGGAVSSAADAWDERHLMARADAALYAAKTRGRNQVVIDGAPSQTEDRGEAVAERDGRSVATFDVAQALS